MPGIKIDQLPIYDESNVDSKEIVFEITQKTIAPQNNRSRKISLFDLIKEGVGEIIAGDGLTGGGILTSNRTINVDNTVIRTFGDQTITGKITIDNDLQVTGVIKGNINEYNEYNEYGKVIIDDDLDVTKGLNIDGDVNFNGQLFKNGTLFRSLLEVNTGDGLLGGGDLTENRTLQVDNTVVRTTGDQTIAGVKTFSSNPISSAAQSADANSLTRRDFVTGLDDANVKLTGNQTIAGIKTFSNLLSLKTYSEEVVTSTWGSATQTVDLSSALVHNITNNSEVTSLTFANAPANKATSFTLILNIVDNGATVAWPSSVKWPDDNLAPTINIANRTFIFSFMTPNGGTTWYGFLAGGDFI